MLIVCFYFVVVAPPSTHAAIVGQLSQGLCERSRPPPTSLREGIQPASGETPYTATQPKIPR